MNFIQIAGHLGADPETRFTSTGTKVSTLRIATNQRKKEGDETIWWRVTLWGERFDGILPHLKKGSALIVLGELNKPEIYQDKEGNSRVSLDIRAEIVKFPPFGKRDQQDMGSSSQAVPQAEPAFGAAEPAVGQGTAVNVNDDIPF